VKNAECLLPQLCCSTEDRKCMGRKCDYCRDSVIQYKADGAPDGNLTFWWEWATEQSSYDKNGVTKISRIMKKQLKHGTVEDLKKLMEQDVKNVLCPHVYNIRHQFSAYKTLKNSLRSQEAVLHIDFSENYVCQYFSEVQSCHFGGGHQQAVLHTGVCYTVYGHFSFGTISDCLRHDASAVWAHLHPVLLFLKEQYPSVDMLHFFSDGPSAQYRNKANFYLLSTLVNTYGMRCATWNMFESGHGKGAPDGVGGTLKRRADDIVQHGGDIPNAKALFDALSVDSAIKVFFVSGENISEVDKLHVNQSAIPGTMKVHQVFTASPRKIALRQLSCFCNNRIPDEACVCYDTIHHEFPVHKQIIQPPEDDENTGNSKTSEPVAKKRKISKQKVASSRKKSRNAHAASSSTPYRSRSVKRRCNANPKPCSRNVVRIFDTEDHTPCSFCKQHRNTEEDKKPEDSWIACASCSDWWHESCAESAGVFDDEYFTCKDCFA